MDHSLFCQVLAENITDGVLFVDAEGVVRFWNTGAQRLTGIEAASICGQPWRPSLVEMQAPDGVPLAEENCPLRQALTTGEQALRRVQIRERNRCYADIAAHFMPAFSHDGSLHGVVVLLRDVSSEMSLETRCQQLQELATRDPLTEVANRAEFDRMHELFVEMHQQQGTPYSLVIADLDHFKSINDRFGHPAGDAALKSFARLLKSYCRLGDVVARYGGEEFVILLTDCAGPAAVSRAEDLRDSLARLPQPALAGRAMTASFGVTEITVHDTAAGMLERADRALLGAKECGRNRVVYLDGRHAAGRSLDEVMSDLRRAVSTCGNERQ